jgi:hypothetical protein
MTGDGLLELRRRTTLVRGINPRGARHWGAASRRQTCMRQVRLDPDHDAVMRIGGIAPGGGPILSVGIGATSATGSRHLGSSTGSPRCGCQQRASAGKKMILQRVRQLAGRRVTPSNGSPMVTNRQSAMSSLRARATIIVLRVAPR